MKVYEIIGEYKDHVPKLLFETSVPIQCCETIEYDKKYYRVELRAFGAGVDYVKVKLIKINFKKKITLNKKHITCPVCGNFKHEEFENTNNEKFECYGCGSLLKLKGKNYTEVVALPSLWHFI